MATYVFRNTTTGQQEEYEMSVHAIDQFKIDNLHLHQLITGFAACSSLTSINKTPAGFRDLLNTIHSQTPGSTLGSHH